MAAENLIMGFCTNMPADQVEVFCRSARAIYPASTTEIVLITNAPDSLAERLHGLEISYRLTACDFLPNTRKSEKLFKRIVAHSARLAAGGFIDRKLWGGACSRFLPTLLEAWCHPLTARWHAYAAVLKERPYVRRVFMTDTKDVLFQADCFSSLDGDVLQLFQEGMTVDQGGWTTSWIIQGYGKAAVESMKGVCVFNAGTMLGSRGAALRFLDVARDMFTRYPFRTVDQGTINWLLHKEGAPDYVVRVPNLAGAVATLSGGSKSIHEVEVRDGLIVRRSDGSVIPIVHMWDRWEKTEGPVLKRYLGRADQTVNA